MIALRKLESLSTRSRIRKAAELFRHFEEEIREGKSIDSYYLAGLCALLYRSDIEDSIRTTAEELENSLRSGNLSLSYAAEKQIGRTCGTIAASLRGILGISPAEWDLRCPATGDLDPRTRRILPLDLFLEDIRSPFNVGTIFRSAEAFGVRHIYLSPATPSPEQPRARRSAMGTADIVPWSVCRLPDAIDRSGSGGEAGHRTLALETGGSSIAGFSFPAEGLLIVGNEEWGVSDDALSRADQRLSIPMGGAKASLNVAVATGIALQHWCEPYFS